MKQIRVEYQNPPLKCKKCKCFGHWTSIHKENIKKSLSGEEDLVVEKISENVQENPWLMAKPPNSTK